MKRFFLPLFALLIVTGASAQNKQGNWIVGTSIGSAGYNFSHSNSTYSYIPGTEYINDGTGFNIGIFPNAGYYVTDRLVIGAEVDLSINTSKSNGSESPGAATSTSKTNYAGVGLSPFGRLYFSENKTGSPFAQIDGGIMFYPGYKTTYSNSGGTEYTAEYKNYHPIHLGARVGYEHFINTVVGIEYYLGYQHSFYNYDYFVDYKGATGTDYSSSYKSNSGNLTFGAGLVIHLACGNTVKK
jgi:hypothetical protein